VCFASPEFIFFSLLPCPTTTNTTPPPRNNKNKSTMPLEELKHSLTHIISQRMKDTSLSVILDEELPALLGKHGYVQVHQHTTTTNTTTTEAAEEHKEEETSTLPPPQNLISIMKSDSKGVDRRHRGNRVSTRSGRRISYTRSSIRRTYICRAD
jgi:hypothetical protein